MFDLSDLSLYDILEIKLDKFEIFVSETLIHEIEPQSLESTSQSHDLNFIT
jgi:hypothetical protein